MPAASDFTEILALNYLLTTESVSRPTAWYVGLFTVAPSDSGGGTEISGNNYARQSVTFNPADQPSTGSTFVDNTATITFPTALGGNWGTIVAIGIYSAVSGGDLYFHGNLTASKVVNENDTFQIQAGNLIISLT